MAADLTEQLHARGKLDEEVITDAFLGMVSSSLFWTTALGNDRAPAPDACQWGRYRKYKNKLDQVGSESHSGADFAFLIGDGTDLFRLALFQAKVEKEIPGSKSDEMGINLHHRSAKADHSQMLRLAMLGAEIDTSKPLLQDGTIDISDFHWIHYLSYAPRAIRATRFSEFVNEFKIESTSTRKEHFVPIPASAVRLSELMLCSMDEPSPGWLPVQLGRIDTFLPTLINLMPIHYVDTGAIPTLANELKLARHMKGVEFDSCTDRRMLSNLTRIRSSLLPSRAPRTSK